MAIPLHTAKPTMAAMESRPAAAISILGMTAQHAGAQGFRGWDPSWLHSTRVPASWMDLPPEGRAVLRCQGGWCSSQPKEKILWPTK